MKKVKKYIVVILLLILPIPIKAIGSIVEQHHKLNFTAFGEAIQMLWPMAVCFIIGLVIGLDFLLNSTTNKVKIGFNLSRVLISILFMVIAFIPHIPIIFNINSLAYLYLERDIFNICMIASGYYMITSLKKPF